jgi:hypothetical protein
MTSFYRWQDDEKLLSVFCRETGDTVYQCYFANFREAKTVADAFVKLYDQGLRHGKLKAVEDMKRTLADIDRNI